MALPGGVSVGDLSLARSLRAGLDRRAVAEPAGTSRDLGRPQPGQGLPELWLSCAA